MSATTTHGFPHGSHAIPIKVAEARQALADGATAGAIVDRNGDGPVHHASVDAGGH